MNTLGTYRLASCLLQVNYLIRLFLIQKHTNEKNLLNANHFGFHALHSTTLQCMSLTDHVTLNFNNNLSTAAVFLDIEKAFAA
jgi:hypothetical protein